MGTAVGLIALAALALWYGNHTPAPAPASAPATEFSAERAMAHLYEIAQRPHPSGTADHARVRAYLLAQLAAVGIPAEVQDVTGVSTRYAVAGRVRNVVARIAGTAPGGQAILLMSHYDGVGAGPAASDAGSGTAALLETARALKAGGPLARDVILLFTDSEESGLNGAAAFATEHPWARDAGMILNFEARGVNGASRMFETGAGNLDAVRMLRRAPGVRASSLSVTVYRMLPNDTDLSEMVVLERPMMNFAFIGGVQRYHTTQDDTTHLSRGSLQHHGVQALALARAFASEPMPRPATGDAAFFDFPLLGLVVYPIGWSLPLALLGALVVAAGIVLLSRRSPGAWRGVLWGAVASLVSIVVAAAACLGVAIVLARVHANASIGGAPQWSSIYAAALALLCVATIAGTWMLLRRRGLTDSAHLGALALISAMAVALAATIPGVSFLFAWPLLVAAVAALLRVRNATPRQVGAIATWVSAAVVLIFFAPTVYAMVAVALGLDAVGAVLLALLTGIALWLVAPTLDPLTAPGRGTLAIVSGAASVVLLGIGLTTVRTTSRAPAGGSFVYAVDGDSLTAWLAGSATTPAARAWMQFALAPVPDGPRPPAWLTRGFDARRIRPVGMAAVNPATVTLLADSVGADSTRVVTLRVQADSGALSVGIVAEPDGAVLAASVDGRAIDRSRYRSRSPRWSLDYVAPPDSGFVLRLTLARGALPMLGVTARRAGIPSLTGYRPPARPDWLLPYQSGDVTIVYRRVRL
jgi:hypothetical protein